MCKQERTTERGVALVMAILALMLLSAVGFGLLYMTNTETGINANYRSSQQAYFAAVAGTQEVRDRLRATHPQRITAPTGLPGAPNSVVFLINPTAGETVNPTDTNNRYFDDELCKENYPALGLTDPGPNQPCTSASSNSGVYAPFVNSTAPFTGTAAAMPYKWVRIAMKANNTRAPYYVDGGAVSATHDRRVCWNGVNEVVLPSGITTCEQGAMTTVYVVTAYARGSRRMTQGEVARVLLQLPAALTLAGPAPTYSAPDSNPFHINGTDGSGTGTPCGGGTLPGIGAYNNAADASISNAIPNNRQDHYIGSSGTSPDVQNVYPQLQASNLHTVQGLEDLVTWITLNANQVLTGPVTNPNIGSDASPLITVVNGDLTMQGSTGGAGVLLVTGTLTSSGTTSFNGIVLVVGQGNWVVEGGGNGQFNGAVLVARTRDAGGNLLSSPGSPTVDWSGGGGNGIYFDSCSVNNGQINMAYTFISTRELNY